MGKKVKSYMGTVLSCIAGSLLVSIAMNQFLTPAGLAPGGITGLAVLINTMTGGQVPVGLCILLLNLPLFWAGYRVLGRQFVLNSVLGTVICSVTIDSLGFTAGYWVMPSQAPLLVCISGGLLLGIGYGLIFRGGASTGGTDIMARLVQRRVGSLSLGQLWLLFDILFLCIVLILYRSVVTVLYIGITVFISSKMVDVVEGGLDYAKEVFVVSPHIEEIGEAVSRKLGRGSTVLQGKGLYSKEVREVLWCVVYNRQLSQLRELVNKYDPNAFITIRNVREVNGLYEERGIFPENGSTTGENGIDS